MKMKLILPIFSLLLIVCQTGAFKSSSQKEAETYLENFKNFDRKSGNIKEAVGQFQEENGIETTGQADAETLGHMRKPRCGDKDGNKKTNKRYEKSNSKWDSGKTYNYYVHPQSFPNSMNAGQVKTAFKVGFGYWAQVSNIGFSESSSTSGSSFSVSFGGRNHLIYDVNSNFRSSTDPSQYDNRPSGVLAHAYFPRNGNLHFDTAETWTEGKQSGINLRIVAAHEMGHSIGLRHSRDRKALMAPMYAGYVSESSYRLPSDDTQGAQSIYGARRGRRSMEKRADKNQNLVTLCAAKSFDSIFRYSDDKVYVVADNKAYKVVDHKVTDEAPVNLGKSITDADAMFYDKYNKRLVVIKGETVLSVTGDLTKPTVQKFVIGGKGAFTGKVTAAFPRYVFVEDGMQYFWAVQGGEMLSGIAYGKDRIVFSRRPRSMKEVFESGDGSPLPESVDAAVVTGSKDALKLLMFTGNSYYVGVPQGKKEMKYMIPGGYPKSFKDYMGC